jgi:hypothetical protein
MVALTMPGGYVGRAAGLIGSSTVLIVLAGPYSSIIRRSCRLRSVLGGLLRRSIHFRSHSSAWLAP